MVFRHAPIPRKGSGNQQQQQALTRFHVLFDKLVSGATDGVLAIEDKRVGLIGLVKHDPNFPEFPPIHCIIHREHLAGKHFRYEDIIKTVLERVNFIRINGKNPQAIL